MSAATFTQTAHIPNTKYGFSGRPQQGYDQYEISFSGLGELGLPYTKTFTFRVTLDGAYFAIAGRDWTSRSFDELLKNYNAGSSAVRSFSTQTMLFDFVVFTDEEIKQARMMWAEEKGIPFVDDEPAVAAPVEEPVADVAPVPAVEDASDSKEEAVIDFEEQPIATEEQPAFCTPKMIRDTNALIRRLTQVISTLQNKERTFLARKSKYAEAIELANNNPRITQGERKRLRDKHAKTEEQMALAHEEFAAAVRERDAALRHLQHLQSLPLGKLSQPEIAHQPVVRSEAASVMVRMLSGDLVEIEIDMNLPVISLMEEFIRQRRFNPSASKRLLFIVDGEEEPLIAHDLSAEKLERVSKKWSELFSDSLPLFHLLIQSPNEHPVDVRSKVDFIRSIAEEKKRGDDNKDEDLYALYSEWILTYLPPAKSNRYINMSAFVDQHPDLFPEMDEETLKAQKAEREYRQHLANFRVLRDGDVAGIEDRLERLARYFHSDIDNMSRIRETNIAALQRQLHENPNLVLTVYEQGRYRQWITLHEMFALGLNPRQICSCSSPNCYVSNWDRLSADLAMAELNGTPLPNPR
jgi:hypothetical protein